MFEEYFNNNSDRIHELLGKSKFPKTAKALKAFYEKNEAIVNSIEAIERKDYYASFILTRSLIEHILIALYIWMKFSVNKDDKTAELYYGKYLIQEVVKRTNYVTSNKIESQSRYTKLFQAILNESKKSGILKQTHFEDLNKAKNEFDIKHISKFVSEQLESDFATPISSARIKEFLEYYNYYSSFIHGGPTAEIIIDDEKRELDFFGDAFKIWSKRFLGLNRYFIFYFLAVTNQELESDFELQLQKFLDEE